MPYLVVHSRGQVIDRRPLNGPVTIGRSHECGLAVHDILLSRKHCQIEQSDDGWWLNDLSSKNGTVIHGRKIHHHLLTDGDVIRLGKTAVVYHDGEMPVTAETPADRPPRPADPSNSLANTVFGMTLDVDEIDLPDHFANPRPAPPLPAAYEREKIHQMLEEIASSSWDSIYAESRKPARQGEMTATIDAPRRRPVSPGVCLSLQVNSDVLASFQRSRSRKRLLEHRGVQKALNTAYRISPWIVALSVIKAAA
jgi:pSer/pThr/pTyr-binding forkhead associated (FHA) protein